MMPLDNPRPGPSYVPAFQLPGIPWVTGSTLATGEERSYSFPNATNFVTVRNVAPSGSTSLAVAFTSNGLKAVNRNFLTLSGSQTITMDVRIKSIFLSNSVGLPGLTFELLAGLTPVHESDFPVLTGSNMSGSAVG